MVFFRNRRWATPRRKSNVIMYAFLPIQVNRNRDSQLTLCKIHLYSTCYNNCFAFGLAFFKESAFEIRLPVLIFHQFPVDFFNVNLLPKNIVITVDIVDDGIVQVVELLQQTKLLSDPLKVWILSYCQAKQFLSTWKEKYEVTGQVI